MRYGADALRTVTAALVQADDPEAVEISVQLERVLGGEIDSVDQAIGLVGSWRLQDAAEARNAIIRDLARSLFPEGSDLSRAKAIAAQWARYRATGWLRDRLVPTMGKPYRRDDARWHFREALKLIDACLSDRRVRYLIGRGDGVATASVESDSRDNKRVTGVENVCTEPQDGTARAVPAPEPR